MTTDFDNFCTAKALLEAGHTFAAVAHVTEIPINSLRHMENSKTHKDVHQMRNTMGKDAFHTRYVSMRILHAVLQYESEHPLKSAQKVRLTKKQQRAELLRIMHKK